MGLISIYLLRFFQNVTFLAAWLSDMPLTKTENTERGFKRNFLKSDLSDWFVKTEKSSSHTFWYWSRLQHLLNYRSDKKHHLSWIVNTYKPLIFVMSYTLLRQISVHKYFFSLLPWDAEIFVICIEHDDGFLYINIHFLKIFLGCDAI